MRLYLTTSAIWRAVAVATIVAGTLDLLGSFVFAVLAGGTPIGVLRRIGGAALDRTEFATGAVLPLAGLVAHFVLTAVMATVFVVLASRAWLVNRLPVLSGIGFGMLCWIVMYQVVLPLRWPMLFAAADSRGIGEQLFCHILLMGIPIAVIAKRATRWRFNPRASRFALRDGANGS